jgi:hypothetical protein
MEAAAIEGSFLQRCRPFGLNLRRVSLIPEGAKGADLQPFDVNASAYGITCETTKTANRAKAGRKEGIDVPVVAVTLEEADGEGLLRCRREALLDDMMLGFGLF